MICSDMDAVDGYCCSTSADRRQGTRRTLDGEARSGFQLEDFSVHLEVDGVDRTERDPADMSVGSKPNSRGAQRHGGDPPAASMPTGDHLEQAVVGSAGTTEPSYLAIRVTLPNTKLSYSSQRPPDRTIFTGVSSVKVRSTDSSSAMIPFRSRFSPTAMDGVNPKPM